MRVCSHMKNEKQDRLEAERAIEQEQGITPKRRGSPAEPSDMPEGELPHPQDVNEIAHGRRKS